MVRAALLVMQLTAALVLAVSPVRAATPDSFADLVERVLPSVVNVSMLPPGADLSAEPRALGSGFVVDSSGLIVTNNHVIENATNIVVIFGEEKPYRAKIRGRDVETDVAVLEIINPDRRFKALQFGDSEGARVGDWVIAIGNPFGIGSSVSAGIVSGQSRDIGAGLYDKFIQTDAAINRGNSGGPLFDRRGRVIGINTVIFSQTGGSVGVGFAVPAELASPIVSQLIENGSTTRGYLGAFLDDVDGPTRQRLGLERNQGALVTGIAVAGGPADTAGLQQGDVIIRFGGVAIQDRRQLTRLIADAPIGEAIPVIINRGGQTFRVTVVLEVREQRLAGIADPGDNVETAGMSLQTVSNELAERYNLPKGTEGVMVTGVSHHLSNSRLQPGDVILELGWEQTNDAEELSQKLISLRELRSGPVKVLVRRGDKLFYETLMP
ncbi:PDZ domain-containing protein [Parvularcula sp. ZS-1/3]|uniref:PDZ domain-containing protein n=1 Tax=Parvularcula mediterranea TaxID=2732508 RepID=A0A7Y3RL33_9PROT|nr:trypsin-like peptidase domain-containing protein [Parvularcula mediterranea]NNU16053.1 PDZ domain-containing protein [Parvularcula mediterranea]